MFIGPSPNNFRMHYLKNTCEALCFPLEKFAMENTGIFFFLRGERSTALLSFLFWNNFKLRKELHEKYSLYPSPRSYPHWLSLSIFPETSENWLQRSQPLKPLKTGIFSWEQGHSLIHSCIRPQFSYQIQKIHHWYSNIYYTKAILESHQLPP